MQCVVLMSSFLKGSYFAKQKNDFHLTDLYMHGRPQEGVWGKGAPAPSPGICKIWRHTLLSCEVPSALAIKTSKFSLKQGQKIKRTTFRLRLRHTDQMSILLQCAEKLSTLLVLVDRPPPPPSWKIPAGAHVDMVMLLLVRERIIKMKESVLFEVK